MFFCFLSTTDQLRLLLKQLLSSQQSTSRSQIDAISAIALSNYCRHAYFLGTFSKDIAEPSYYLISLYFSHWPNWDRWPVSA